MHMENWINRKMNKFYIITNSEKDEGLKVSLEIAQYLESRGNPAASSLPVLAAERLSTITQISV